MTTVDWSQWLQLDEEGRAALVRRYKQIVDDESRANAQKWASMSPAERARYPQAREQ